MIYQAFFASPANTLPVNGIPSFVIHVLIGKCSIAYALYKFILRVINTLKLLSFFPLKPSSERVNTKIMSLVESITGRILYWQGKLMTLIFSYHLPLPKEICLAILLYCYSFFQCTIYYLLYFHLIVYLYGAAHIFMV